MNTDLNHDADAPPELAAAIGLLTHAEGETAIWQSALSAARPARARRLSIAVKGFVALVILTFVVGLLLPSMGKARSSARFDMDRAPPAASPSVDSPPPTGSAGSATSHAQPSRRSLYGRYRMELDNVASDAQTAGFGTVPHTPDVVQAPADAKPQEPPDRQVIRKANIDLKARDVRATFLKASQVLSEARGEYIEQSSLTGQDENLQASLTLRVSANRLSEVLNQLRGLATVTSESSGGEDVTNQVVDLEARLRNEQRVETELLGLMETRKDAPLKEILELRDSISRVRENIERMTAQRERLGRLVSLATVLVIINPDTTKPAPLPDGLGHYFLKQVRAAWQGSLELLADSLAFLIRLFIGGAIFWLGAILIVLAILFLRRRALRASAAEPAPQLG